MIRAIGVRGFKSLAIFKLEALEKLTCLVGLNGAGKSSVIQLFDFSSHLMNGTVDRWLDKRSWSTNDLSSKFLHSPNILILIRIELDGGRIFDWTTSFSKKTRSCFHERITDRSQGKHIFELAKGTYRINDGEPQSVDFKYIGSVFSALKEELLPADVVKVKNTISNIRSLELLSPHLMRYPLRDATSDIGAGGEKLAPFLYNLKGEQKEHLVHLLRSFYPNVVDFRVQQQRAGWKKLIIIEEYDHKRFETEAKHINDGLLRILAMIAQISSKSSLLLLDEVENGVNPEVIERLVGALQQTQQQILITTHSPMILNYLDDDFAVKSVQFIYRDRQGGTRSRPLFSIPRMKDKLALMGPGEAFVDTNLTFLSEECLSLDANENIRTLEAEVTK